MKDLNEVTKRILDSKDIISIIKRHDGLVYYDITVLMNRLEFECAEDVSNYPELEGSLFKNMDLCEFSEYLKKRYNDKFHSYEVTSTKYSFDE